MTVFEFARLTRPEKEVIIQKKAVLFESYLDGSKRITVYYIPGFFIEVNTCLIKQELINIIPFIQGTKIEKEKDMVYKDLHNKFLFVA